MTIMSNKTEGAIEITENVSLYQNKIYTLYRMKGCCILHGNCIYTL